MNDPYFDVIEQHRQHIVRLYDAFADKNPIILFDLQEERIYVYPYEAFRADLTSRSRASLAEQYRLAMKGGAMVVFVRDNVACRLVSYSVPVPSSAAE